MTTPIDCLPWWHEKFDKFRGIAEYNIPLSVGCPVNSSTGNAPCAPETMRARCAEKLTSFAEVPPGLTLDEYTLARYMQSEQGSGTVEERVLVGEIAVNRSRQWRLAGVTGILLYRQKAGHPNRGFYGPIHPPSGVDSAPYGRWAATSRDPTALTVMLAKFVLSGASANFGRGAVDQVGLEYYPDTGGSGKRCGSCTRPILSSGVRAHVINRAREGEFWVGALPNVDPWSIFARAPLKGQTDKTPIGARQVQLTLEQLGQGRPSWGDLPICGRPIVGPGSVVGAGGTLAAAGLLATVVGAWVASRWSPERP